MLLALGIVLGLLLAISLWARSASPPPDLGIEGGHLRPCPDSPNCVVTDGATGIASMPPWKSSGPEEAVREQLKALIRTSPGATLVREEPGYLHAEFRTPVLGFIDDVEFRIDSDSGWVHFRSASRLGHSDLGVNRRRMEALGRRFAAGNGAASSSIGATHRSPGQGGGPCPDSYS